MEQLRFQQYGRRLRHSSIPLLNGKDLLRYFSPAQLQPRIRPGLDLLTNLRRAVTASRENLLGFNMFYDEAIEIQAPPPLFHYYVGRFQLQRKDSLLALVETACNVLNYLRMAILQAKKAMDSYIEDESEEEVVVRSLLELEIENNRLDEIYQEQQQMRGFSRTVHYKFEDTRSGEVTVFVGFCDRSQQFVHLLLSFREASMKRMKVEHHDITLNNLDNVVEHLVVVARRIAGEKDYNLFDAGVRAVLETYVWPGIEQIGFTRDALLGRFREHQRLLLLYQCNYAYLHMYTTSSRGDLNQVMKDPFCLYRLLFQLLINSKGLLLRNQDISYCSSSYLRPNGELATIIGCEKKNTGLSVFWSTENFVAVVVERLVAFFQRKFLERNSESSTLNESIRSTLQMMGSSRTLVKSRLEMQGDYLVAVPINIRLQHEHFSRQFDRLLKLLDRSNFNSEYVEQLVHRICNAHRKKMERLFAIVKGLQGGRVSNLASEQVLRMCIAKTMKFLTLNSDALVHVLEATKDRLPLMLALVVRNNPYANDASHFKVVKLLAARCLKRNYEGFLHSGGMEHTRRDLLYQYLCAVLESRQVTLDISHVGLEEEVVGLLTTDAMERHSFYYSSLLQKLAPLIFTPLVPAECEDASFINSIFKLIEQELKLHSSQESIYSFLGGLYFECVYGPQLAKVQTAPTKLSNTAYRTKTVSQLTADIKRTKVLELLKIRGLSSQMFAVHKFFDGLTTATQVFPGIAYQIYRDFFVDNYPLRMLLKAVARTTTSIDMIPVSKCIAGLEDELEGLLEPNQGQQLFTLFDEDIENFVLPQPAVETGLSSTAKLSKDLQLSKTFEQSRIVRQLYQANPNTKLAGVQIRDLFTDRSAEPNRGVDLSLYDRETVMQKILGISLQQAEQLLTVYDALRNKSLAFSDMSEQEKAYFNEQVNRLLLQESKLRRCMSLTSDLELYLRRLERTPV